jgi:hypothetical protein
VDALDDTHQFQLQSGEERWKGIGRFATLGNPDFDEMTSRFVLCFLSVTEPRPGSHREFPDDHGMFRPSRTFEGIRLTALHFRLESRPSARCFEWRFRLMYPDPGSGMAQLARFPCLLEES